MIELLLGGLLLYESILDVRKKQIWIIPVIIMSCVGVIFNLLSGRIVWLEIVSGLFIGAGALFLSFITREKLGYGDSLMILCIGICMGGKCTLLIVWISLIITAFFGLIYSAIRRKNLKTTLPYIPFLEIAFIISYMILIGETGGKGV